MRVFLILSFNLLLVAYSYGQIDFKQRNLEYYNLRGRVVSVEIHKENGTEMHRFDEGGQEVMVKNSYFDDDAQFMNRPYSVTYSDSLIEVLVFGTEDKHLWKGLYQINSYGNIENEIWDNISDETSMVSDFLYDDNGKLLSESICRPYFDDFDTKMMYTIQYFYNEDGLLSRTDKLDLIADKQIVSELSYRWNGILLEKIVHIKNAKSSDIADESYKVKYDKNTNELERSVIDESSKTHKTESKIKYNRNSNIRILKLYDKKGDASVIKNKYSGKKLVESKFKLSDGSTQYILLNTYDEYGNITSSSMQYMVNAELSTNVEFLYEYDEVGNWISKTTVVDGNSISSIKRVIDYY